MRPYLFALLIGLLCPTAIAAQSSPPEDRSARLRAAPRRQQAGLLNELAETYLTKEPRKSSMSNLASL